MKKRKLGKSRLEVSALCLGGNVFGWTADERASFAVLDAFVAGGGNFIDTADVYSRWVPGHQGGESETILGRWMKERGNRAEVIVATKVGMEMGPGKKGLAKSYIFQAVEDSLRRLQTDHIDLYISHAADPATPINETMEAYAALIKQGKIRVAGASNYSAAQLREAMKTGVARYQSLQPQYNLYDRAEFENDLRPVCAEFGLGVTPYYALASGFLSGKYRGEKDLGKSARGGGVGKRYLNPRGHRILKALDQVAQRQRATLTAIALAWLLHQPTITAPIVSATSVEQVQDLIASTRVELDAASLSELDHASAPGKAD